MAFWELCTVPQGVGRKTGAGRSGRWHGDVDRLESLQPCCAQWKATGEVQEREDHKEFVFWTISLEGVWKCERRMGITESRKTVHLSSICWAPSLCQTLWQGLRIPNGVQRKGEPLRTHSRGGVMNQCFNSILWLVWLQEGRRWLSLTSEIYSPSPLSVELCRVIWSPQSSPVFPPSSNTLTFSSSRGFQNHFLPFPTCEREQSQQPSTCRVLHYPCGLPTLWLL